MRLSLFFSFVAAVFLSTVEAAAAADQPRRVISLDGTWQVAEGKLDHIPANFDHLVPVSGLVSLAMPPFDAPGPKVANRESIMQKDPRRDAFWYRRTFPIKGPIPAVAIIKVAKVMFGTRVFLNGSLLGDHAPSFTPGYFDAKPKLKTGVNELLIRVGADRDAVGRAHPDGFDFEKDRYIPGIFDSVELILSGTPHFTSLQASPDIAGRTVRVQAVLRNDGEATKAAVKFVVREAKIRQDRRAACERNIRVGQGRGNDGGRPHPDRQLPVMVARRPVPLHARSRQRRGHDTDAVRHARVQVRSRNGPGDAQRQAVFHARQQHHALPLLRGRRVWKAAVEQKLGATAAPADEGYALELSSILHRLPAGGMV